MMDFLRFPELLEKIGHLRDQMRAKSEPLEVSASGRDVRAAIGDMRTNVARELKLYSRAIGARKFIARIYVMREVRKGSRRRWEQVDVQMAEQEFIPGGPEHLKALMTRTMEVLVSDSKAIAFWVHPMLEPDNDAFFTYALHSDGFETALVQHDGDCTELRLSEAAIQLMLVALLRPRESRMKSWRQLANSLPNIMDVDLREDFTDFLKRQGGQALTDETWGEFIEMVFFRHSFLIFMHEVGRATSAPLLNESQNLLKTLVTLVEKTLEEHNEKQAQMEKAHSRAMARFKTDLARERATKDVASKRVKQVEREAAELRKQLQQAGTGPAAAGRQQSIGLTLDRFFT